ncbi:MAG: 4Fe-4S single cluster domain-containing protein [Bryobacteraceae bacterium]
MLIHGFVAHSRVNGPGVRAVVYFQGCNLGCDGCWNPSTHAFIGPSHDAADVAEQIARAHRTYAIEGVTFSGGEPMQQAPDLLALIRLLKGARPDLSIGMYSGYSKRELESARFGTRCGIEQGTRLQVWGDIKQSLDFAVLGRFVVAKPSKLPLRTSANQDLHLFSDRYNAEHFKPLEFEIQIESGGLVQITGFPLAGLPV